MFSYYLQDRSYYFASSSEIKSHILALNKIIANSDGYDHFYKSKQYKDRVCDRWGTTIGTFLEESTIPKYMIERVIPRIFRRVTDLDVSYMSVTDFNQDYQRTSNAFLCAKTRCKSVAVLTDYDDYIFFRAFMALQTAGNANFQNCCRIMLKKVVVTKDACDMVRPLGKKVKQVFEHLMHLDKYLQNEWEEGSFNENDVAAKTPLNISDESDTVKRDPSYKHERYFRIPGIGGRYCFIHIKMGTLRFHIYADDESRTVYVPYIGKHLPTPSFQ